MRITLEHHRARGESDVVAALEEGRAAGGPHEALRRAADVLAGRYRESGAVRIAGFHFLHDDPGFREVVEGLGLPLLRPGRG